MPPSINIKQIITLVTLVFALLADHKVISEDDAKAMLKRADERFGENTGVDVSGKTLPELMELLK